MRLKRSLRWPLLTLLAGCATLLAVPGTHAQTSPITQFLGFSPKIPPADSLSFRQAVAYAIDREGVAKAVAPHLEATPQPATSIQHPKLPGYNPEVRGYALDPQKARTLYAESGWTGAITILVGPAATKFLETYQGTVAESIRKSLGADVIVQRVANFSVLGGATRTGIVPIWMYGWRSDPRDYAYPSFALAFAHDYFRSDPEIKAVVDRGDAKAAEQMLLDKALLIPIILY